MPKGTRVHRCVEDVKKSGGDVNPYAVCQASTGQNYHTGESLKGKKDLENSNPAMTKNQDGSSITTGTEGAEPSGGTLSGHSFGGKSQMNQQTKAASGSVGGIQKGPKHTYGGGVGNGKASGSRSYGSKKLSSKSIKNIQSNLQTEKKFLKERWKALKGMDQKDMDVQFEKSFISDRWKSIAQEEKKLKSVADKKDKASKKDKDPVGTFVTNMSKKKYLDDMLQAKDFLKSLAEHEKAGDEIDAENKYFTWGLESQLKAYHLGQTIQDNIKALYGSRTDPSGFVNLQKRFISEADSEVNVTEKKNDPKIAKLGADSKINPAENGPCLLDHWGGSGKSMPSYPEMDKFTNKVEVHQPHNDSKIAAHGQDSDYNPVEQGEKLPLRGKKEFPEMDEQLNLNEVSKEKNPAKIAKLHEDDRFNPINGPSFVKLLKISADASNFLKSLGREKALSIDHKEAANAFLKAYEEVSLDSPKLGQDKSEFPGDSIMLQQEAGEPEHKAIPGGDMGGGMDMLGGMGEEEDEDLLGDMGGLGGLGDEGLGDEELGGLGDLGDEGMEFEPDFDIGGLGDIGGEEDLELGGEMGGGPEDLLGLDEEEDENVMKSLSKSLDTLHANNVRTTQAALRLSETVNGLLARF